MDILARAFGRTDTEEFSSLPLSENSEALHALLSGWVGVGVNGLKSVSESSALSIPAFGRAVSLIAGTIAGLPLKTYEGEGAQRRRVSSVFDRPQGPMAISAFQWVEQTVAQLVCYREAYLHQLVNDGGAIVGYWPIHPAAITKVEWTKTGSKRFTVHYAQGGDKVMGTPDDPTTDGVIVQVMGPDLAGLRGIAVWETYKSTFQTALASMEASARVFTGPLIRGLVTTDGDEELGDDPEEEAQIIVDKLNARIAGVENSNQMAFVNRHLKFMPWQQTNADAQFSETRTFEIEEFARITGLPPHLLAAIDKQTSWGAGVAEQNVGLARYTLMAYTSRIESALKSVMPSGQFVEFDYKGLFQGTPQQEIGLLLEQVNGGILTKDEARAILNMRPLPKSEAENDDEAQGTEGRAEDRGGTGSTVRDSKSTIDQ